ncbi:hypothetical protein NDU88_004255 [Pleurodeles waltl]|uniref:Uncharacterized protein n=1 Tax=Pleurodeles waltl TaxID=8319 RepID=A0AAV7V2G6_PLEWA|nr:hypothetical protein NDU88_004255 [Pleurodeles waltl]
MRGAWTAARIRSRAAGKERRREAGISCHMQEVRILLVVMVEKARPDAVTWGRCRACQEAGDTARLHSEAPA